MNGSILSTAPLQPPPPEGGADDLIELLRTLADPVRLRLLRLLEVQPRDADSAGDGLSVGELADILKLPQSTVSRHLKMLSDSRLTDARREGTSIFYRLGDRCDSAGAQLRALACQRLERDPAAKADAHRLAALLRRREAAHANASAESFFGRHAPRWDQLRAQWFGDAFHLEALLALMDPAWTLADIGAGTGAMLPLLAPHVKKIIAVDPSPAMLKGARARVKELNLLNVEVREGSAGNGEPLPIHRRTVDVALVALALAYMPDPPGALREIKRILSPGGIILIIDLQPHAVELFRKELNHAWMGFAQEDLFSWLKQAGFRNLRWHSLLPRISRSKNASRGDSTPVPDLFALRAEAGLTTESQRRRERTEKESI